MLFVAISFERLRDKDPLITVIMKNTSTCFLPHELFKLLLAQKSVGGTDSSLRIYLDDISCCIVKDSSTVGELGEITATPRERSSRNGDGNAIHRNKFAGLQLFLRHHITLGAVKLGHTVGRWRLSLRTCNTTGSARRVRASTCCHLHGRNDGRIRSSPSRSIGSLVFLQEGLETIEATAQLMVPGEQFLLSRVQIRIVFNSNCTRTRHRH
mmetsp:Transcript_35050/g.71570  ORF Transcript_35050/g.71570 Transcript_35050/m.71570 type:complete len:211 (+) Transcript_35050:918-1550(+)